MVVLMVKAKSLNILSLRKLRQEKNLQECLNGILKKKISKFVNANAWKKTLKLLDLSKEEIFCKSRNDKVFGTLLASTVCKNASRQCSLDEDLQIKTCNDTTSTFGVFIEKLRVNDCVPLKSGALVSRKFLKEHSVPKNECLKSFDAKISGKLDGYVFAKIVIGDGGHQDNVFEEAYTICEWVVKFGSKTNLFAVLIDSDSPKKISNLKEKFPIEKYGNLLIGNCLEVQNHFIKIFK